MMLDPSAENITLYDNIFYNFILIFLHIYSNVNMGYV